MTASCDVLIVAEQLKGQPKRMALELATKARQLASGSGGKVSAVVVGPGAIQAAEKLGEYGVDSAFVSEDERFDRFPVMGEASIIESAMRETDAGVVLMGASGAGRDVAGRLAARLRVGVIGGSTDVQFVDGEVQISYPAFGGSIDEVKGFVGKRGIVLLRPNAVTAEKVSEPAAVSIEQRSVDFGGDSEVEVLENVVEPRPSLPVEEASVVVTGGRGVGGPEGFKVVRELAEALGGSVGSTRAVVDAGWIEYSTQIGQTGKTVKPKLYVALGVSGAVQHRVGMQTSDVIVAINKNPDASIFQYSDLGVVGDLFEIVPKLVEQIQKRKQG